MTKSLHDQYPGFSACIESILSHDSLAFEDAFEWLTGGYGEPRIKKHFNELVDLLSKQTIPRFRARIIELIGYTGDKRAIHLLQKELSHESADVCLWAVLSLEELPFPEAIELARGYRAKHPEL